MKKWFIVLVALILVAFAAPAFSCQSCPGGVDAYSVCTLSADLGAPVFVADIDLVTGTNKIYDVPVLAVIPTPAATHPVGTPAQMNRPNGDGLVAKGSSHVIVDRQLHKFYMG